MYDIILKRKTASLIIALLSVLNVTCKTTMLPVAAKKGDLARMKSEIAKGANVDERFRGRNSYDFDNGKTPLMFAVSQRNLPAVKFLLSKGANVNKADDNGYSAIIYACWAARPGDGVMPQVVALLVARGADLDYTSGRRDTLLHFAAGSGNVAILKQFIDRGLKVNVKNDIDLPPIFEAGSKKHWAAVAYLESKGSLKWVNVKRAWDIAYADIKERQKRESGPGPNWNGVSKQIDDTNNKNYWMYQRMRR